MNRSYAHAFESFDDGAFEMTDRLLDLLNGETDIEDLDDEDLVDLDDDTEEFDLH
ncbi:MAG: hypothetical protein ACKVQT_26610 [Burkholderiales bacterium]